MESKRRTLIAVVAGVSLVLATTLLSVIGRTTPDLSTAVADGNHAQAQLLLDGGAEPNGQVLNGFAPLMRASIRDDGRMVRLLIEAGADTEIRASAGGLTPLHAAAVADSADALTALIEQGADLDARSVSGRNALDHAAAAGSVRAIEVLSAAGVDVNTPSEVYVNLPGYPPDQGPAPIAIAAGAGRLEAVEALLALGADVDALSKRGQTALLHAIASGQSADVVALLLQSGADPTTPLICVTGCAEPEADVLELARRFGAPDVVELLEDHVEGELAVAADSP